MYRNHYDTDCITWSPQGRIFQIEYAMEAVKQGTCIVGLKSKTHVVLCSLRRSVSKLAGHHQKLFEIDSHIGVAMSGITADAKILSNFMRMECLNHRFIYDSPMTVERLVALVADRSQVNTQRYSKRPYGVGLLVAGYDSTGSHLFETSPSGMYFEYVAMALGSRSQSSKTYLEKHFEQFADMRLEKLVECGVTALRASIAQDNELTVDNLSIAIVGKDHPLRELKLDEVRQYLERVPAQTAEDAPMDVD